MQLDRIIDSDIYVNVDLEGRNCNTDRQNLSRVSWQHVVVNITAIWRITKCNKAGNVRIT